MLPSSCCDKFNLTSYRVISFIIIRSDKTANKITLIHNGLYGNMLLYLIM